ncbi:alpha/beta hydrolase [Rhodococcus sp. NPDC003318]|uniref:alpha/beta hydrolase n=1 Tax=Rhodococcus sp. NPDC003318 TaxID=3364503 RepID=UPI0036BFFF61
MADGSGSVGVRVPDPGADDRQGERREDSGHPDPPPGTDGSGALARGRRYLGRFTLPGSWGALILACLSFTPSLLPRGGFLQGLVWGITASIGYGLGVWAAAIWRAFADRPPRPARRRSWQLFAVVAVVLLVGSFAAGQYWQHQIRALMGVTEYNVALAVASPLIAAIVFCLLVAMGRGIRNLYHWVGALLRRWIGARAAAVVGWALVALLVWWVVSGVLLSGLSSLANEAFSVKNGTTEEGVEETTSGLRSGGPGSVVPWDTLGYQGRNFVAGGPTPSEITEVVGRPAEEPIRTYAGLESADSSEARAVLAVDDLERAGGFQRKNLLVMTTTGSGWVDPAAVDAFEYLTDGDAATVTMQYSYLPSWISYLVDQSKAREAGRDLFDAVYDRWSKLPQDERPNLYVAGESLGSFGGETAFSGEYDLRNRTSGTLFAGPPNFNTLFTEFREGRDAGSLESEPTYKDGRTVRFTSDAAAGIPPAQQSWDGSRVLYLMHPSDPIVWWSPDLIFSEPDWISEPPGHDVLEDMVWMPFVTFWQVTADLPFSTGVPGGHGHHYTTEYVDGWNAVLQPDGMTDADLDRIKSAVAGE